MVADSVFALIRKVGVGWSKRILKRIVSVWPGIGVLHEHGDWRAGGFAFPDSRHDPHGVGFLSLGRDHALSRAPAIQIALDFLMVDRDKRRAAVDHDSDSPAMALTPGADAKQIAETISHLNVLP
ncbi:MAG: hypothetical protein BWY82_02374 [Verrucomicrobia bacterium ADurb.Bin474]|nr:MAG: hypothetical protein BWY82_02374 [Verrucomicrobia bacterium ADurb.Bin474]